MADPPSLPGYIQNHLIERYGRECIDTLQVEEAKSAQQKVWILTFSTSTVDSSSTANKVVVRLWKNASRWWNLNHADGILSLARSEAAGYRVARLALSSSTSIHIPELLYFSESDDLPWALTEYVGPSSSLFQESAFNDLWTLTMVKVREEFGFAEPHPRWGRVPEENALDYTLIILRQVVIPIHRYLLGKKTQLGMMDGLSGWEQGGYTYQSMVDLYKKELITMQQAVRTRGTTLDSLLLNSIETVEKAIERLSNQEAKMVHDLPPVLCHMDLQPQNLLFHHSVASVLDWEEAGFADPRFELLLLCRKVCANHEQANAVWETYARELPEPCLGPIDPWLRLETIHSLMTLLLQSLDLLGGGRSPWETKPDLWGKIEREFLRLYKAGWYFCQLDANVVDVLHMSN